MQWWANLRTGTRGCECRCTFRDGAEMRGAFGWPIEAKKRSRARRFGSAVREVRILPRRPPELSDGVSGRPSRSFRNRATRAIFDDYTTYQQLLANLVGAREITRRAGMLAGFDQLSKLRV